MADNVYNLKFTLSNGDVIDAGQITAPQGPKGDKGDSATIDADTLNGLLSGSNGIAIAKNAAGDKVEVGISLPIVFSGASPGVGSGGTIIKGTYTSGYPAAAMIHLESPTYKTLISPVQIAMSGTSSGHTYKLELTPTGIGYTYDGTAYSILRQDNVKTLFGNQQSIYGSGNIDLYSHTVRVTKSGNIDMISSFVSSKNTVIDSLTDLFNAGLPAFYPASGKIKSGENWYPVFGFETYSSGGILYTSLTGGSGVVWSDISSGLTITDTVTTV